MLSLLNPEDLRILFLKTEKALFNQNKLNFQASSVWRNNIFQLCKAHYSLRRKLSRIKYSSELIRPKFSTEIRELIDIHPIYL